MSDSDNPEYRTGAHPAYHIYRIQAGNSANLANALRPFELSPIGWRVLAHLQESDGHNLGHLARLTATERSTLSRVVAGMERAGLLARQPETRDKRNMLIYLTPHGERIFHEALPSVLKVIDASVAGFSEAEIDTLMHLLRRMNDNVQRTAYAPPAAEQPLSSRERQASR